MTKAEWKLWFSDNWAAWIRPVSLIGLVAALAGAHFLGWMGESPFARLMVVAFALVAAVAPAVQGVRLATKRWARPTVAVLGLVWVAALVWPVWKMVAPGEPVARRTLAKGESLDVAASPSGALMVLVEDAELLGGGSNGMDRVSDYKVLLTDGGDRREALSGELSRRHQAGRGRKGVAVESEKVHAAEVHTVAWADGAPLRVTLASGGASLLVEVFSGAVPWVLLFVLVGLTLIVGLVVDALALPPGDRTFVPHAALVALLFLVMVRDALDPIAPVSPLFGTMLMAPIAGVVGGVVLSWVGRKILAPKPVKAPAKARV